MPILGGWSVERAFSQYELLADLSDTSGYKNVALSLSEGLLPPRTQEIPLAYVQNVTDLLAMTLYTQWS